MNGAAGPGHVYHYIGRIGKYRKHLAISDRAYADFVKILNLLKQTPGPLETKVQIDHFYDGLFTNYNAIASNHKYFNLTAAELKQHLHVFELVNTDYYFLIKDDIGHLIHKSPNALQASTKTLYSPVPTNNLLKQSLYERINQRNILQIYVHNFELQTRFQKLDDIHFYLTKIVVPDQHNIEDYYYLELNTFNDAINEVLTVPKPILASMNFTSFTEYKKMTNEHLWQNDDFLIKRLEARHKRVEEDYKIADRWYEGKLGQFGKLVNLVAGLPSLNVAKTTKSVTGMMSDGYEPHKISRDESALLHARFIENLECDIAHKRISMTQKHAIREMSTIRERGQVNSRTVAEVIATKVLDTTPIFIKNYRPSHRQIKFIEVYYRRFGVDCLIPQFTLILQPELSGVYEFDTIDFIGTADPALHTYLETTLIAGIRIIDFNNPDGLDNSTKARYIPLVPASRVGYEQEIKKLENEKTNLQNAQKDLTTSLDEYFEQSRELKQENERLALLQKEMIDNQNELNQTIAKLHEEQDRYKEYLKEAKDSIRKLRKDYAEKAIQLREMLKERNKFAEDLQATQDNLKTCNAQKDDLQKQLLDTANLTKEIEKQRDEVVNQLKQVELQKADLEQKLARERRRQNPNAELIEQYERQLNELKEKEKELQDKVDKLHSALSDTEKCKQQVQTLTECLNRYKEEYKLVHTAYTKSARFIYHILNGIQTLTIKFDEAIVPAVVNNKGYTGNYREGFNKHYETFFNPGNGFVDNGNNGHQLYLPIHHHEGLTDDNRKRLDEIIFYNDPSKQHLGGGIDADNVNKINRLNSRYSANLFRNMYIGHGSYRTPYVGPLISPDKLAECVPPKEVIDVTSSLQYKELKAEYDAYKEKAQRDIAEQVNTATKEIEKKYSDEKDAMQIRHEEAQRDGQAQLTVCNNNLDRYRKAYTDLERENAQNINVINLYNAEIEKFKTDKRDLQAEIDRLKGELTTATNEKVQALKDRDDARADLLKEQNYYKANPIDPNALTAEQQVQKAGNVGANFYSMLKNAHYLKSNIDGVIKDYKARTRSKNQTIANLGYYLNYTIDDIVRVMRPYLGEKETAFAYSKKIPPARLQNIIQ